MDLIHCKNCGRSYMPGESSYCSKCGERLSTKSDIVDEINKLEREVKPYEALRFTSGVIVFLGWVVIIAGWITVGMIYTFTVSVAENVMSGHSYTVINNVAKLFAFFEGSGVTIFGLMMIAFGQVFQVILDLRNDTHTTMRLVRRFGLMMSDEARPVRVAD